VRDLRRLAAFVVMRLLLALFSSSREAQQFYAGNNVLRVFGGLPLDTLTSTGRASTANADAIRRESS